MNVVERALKVAHRHKNKLFILTLSQCVIPSLIYVNSTIMEAVFETKSSPHQITPLRYLCSLGALHFSHKVCFEYQKLQKLTNILTHSTAFG